MNKEELLKFLRENLHIEIRFEQMEKVKAVRGTVSLNLRDGNKFFPISESDHYFYK